MAVNLTEEQKRLLAQQQQTIKDQQLPIAPVAPPNVNSITGQPTMLRNAAQSVYNAVSGVVTPVVNAASTGFSNAVNYVDRSFPEIRQYAGAAASGADQFIPPATTGSQAPVTPGPVQYPQRAPAPAPAPAPAGVPTQGPIVTPAIDPTYGVMGAGGRVTLDDGINKGYIEGLTPEQQARVVTGMRDYNRARAFGAPGQQAQAPATPAAPAYQAPAVYVPDDLFRSQEKSRLEDVLNKPFSAESMSPGQLIGALVERRSAQSRYNAILQQEGNERMAAMQAVNAGRLQAQQIAGTSAANQASEKQKSEADRQREAEKAKWELQKPSWKADITKVVDANGVENLVTTMSDANGRSYQVPDANDLAALKALPNDNARIQMLRRAGIPDEHIPRYLQGLQ